MGRVTFWAWLFWVALVIGACCWSARAAVTDWPAAQYLMADQHGNIQPPGYAAGLTEIARVEAEAAAAEAAAQAVSDAMASASNTVDAIVSALTGTVGFGYVTGYVVSFAGAVEVSTNATAAILLMELGAAGTMTTNGVAHTGHHIWHAYSEAMNSTPAIKYRSNLDATNAWEFAEYQSTAEFTDTVVNGTLYATVYRSTVWLPSSLNSAFFMAFCEIVGGGSAGEAFDVVDGFTINGARGYTGVKRRDGYDWHYENGALMRVEAVP